MTECANFWLLQDLRVAQEQMARLEEERGEVILPPTPYTLQSTPYTLHPTPYTLHTIPYTLHTTPCTLHPRF